MIRKTYCLLLVLALLIAFTGTAYAADITKYHLDELGMSIEIPSGLVVFTRHIDENDPNLKKYGYTKQSLLSSLTASNFYLVAIGKNSSYEIDVAMQSNTISSIESVNDADLSALSETLRKNFSSLGANYIKSETYQSPQVKFIKLFYSSKNSDYTTTYGLHYFSIKNYMTLNLAFRSNSGPISSDMETMMDGIADSVVFDNIPQATPVISQTSAFTYTDAETKAKFTVPANWSEKALTSTEQYIDAKFAYNGNALLYIMFGSLDVWNEMTPSERVGYTRKDCDSSLFTKEDIAKMNDVKGSQLSSVTYKGREYYQLILSPAGDGSGLIPKMTEVFYIEDGYMYMFLFCGTSEHERYPDFEALLESVVYPSSPKLSSSASSSRPVFSSPTASGNTADITVEGVILSLIITIAVYSLPIIIYRYGIRKESVEPSRARQITIIYGIIAFFIMSVLLYALGGTGTVGGAIFFWSFINYRMLTRGLRKESFKGVYENSPNGNSPYGSDNKSPYSANSGASSGSGAPDASGASDTSGAPGSSGISGTSGAPGNSGVSNASGAPGSPGAPVKPDAPNVPVSPKGNTEEPSQNIREYAAQLISETGQQREPQIHFCHKCGKKLIEDSVFCRYCGTKIPDIHKDTERR